MIAVRRGSAAVPAAEARSVRQREVPRILHPFDRLEQQHLAAATVGLALAFGLLTVVLLSSVPPEDLSRIRDLVGAGSATAARAALADWPASTFQAFSFLLGFDFLYDLVHNNGVAVFAIWGARRLAVPRADLLASLTAWVLWLDSALNVFENLAFLHILRTLEPSPLLPIAAGVFSFRSITLTASLLVGLTLHALVFWRSRVSAARSNIE